MPDDSTAEQYTGLPLDEEIDAIIDAHESGDVEALAAATLVVGDAQKFAWGMGRALARLKARDDELLKQLQMLVSENNDARAQLSPSMTFLEEQLEAMTLERRESGAGNHLDVPGVGRWSTRKVAAGWDINDATAVIESLNADDRALYVEDRPHLDGPAFRTHLDETGEVPPGVERRPERVSVSYKLNGGAS